MTRLIAPLKISTLILRNMMSESQPQDTKKKHSNNNELDEIQVDTDAPQLNRNNHKPEVEVPPLPKTRSESTPNLKEVSDEEFLFNKSEETKRIFGTLSPEQKSAIKQKFTTIPQELNSQGNMTNEIQNPPEPIKVEPFILTKEALMADTAVKGVVTNINEIGERIGVTINQNDALAAEWKTELTQYEKFVLSIKGSPFSKWAIWSAGIILVGSFLWKMGMLRSVPSFARTIITSLPIPDLMKGTTTQTVTETSATITKPGATAIYNTIMETPLGPTAVIGSTLALGFGIGLLKGVFFILRKMPK